MVCDRLLRFVGSHLLIAANEVEHALARYRPDIGEACLRVGPVQASEWADFEAVSSSVERKLHTARKIMRWNANTVSVRGCPVLTYGVVQPGTGQMHITEMLDQQLACHLRRDLIAGVFRNRGNIGRDLEASAMLTPWMQIRTDRTCKRLIGPFVLCLGTQRHNLAVHCRRSKQSPPRERVGMVGNEGVPLLPWASPLGQPDRTQYLLHCTRL